MDSDAAELSSITTVVSDLALRVAGSPSAANTILMTDRRPPSRDRAQPGHAQRRLRDVARALD